MLNLPTWILRRQSEHFLQALIETKAQVDDVTERRVRSVLREMRWQRAIAPYLYIFKLAWESIYGGYRSAFAKDDSDSNSTSGGSPGAGGQPVAQFTGYAAGVAQFSVPTTFSSGVSQPADNPPKFFEDAGIVAGEVIAYRCWRLCDGLLHSVYRNDFCWKPGGIVEGDAANGDGVHAFKSVILLGKYGGLYSEDGTIVTGTVELWGDVFEHERGYRASKAAIRTIDDSPDYDAKALRKLYGLNKRKPRKKMQ